MRDKIAVRKIRLSVFLLAVVTLLTSGSAAGAPGAAIKLAVMGLRNPATLPKSNIGNSLVAILDSDIGAAGKYTLLERAQLQQLKRELNLGESGLANVKSFVQKGGLVGADFLLDGTVSDYTYTEHRSVSSQLVPGVGWRQVVAYQHVANVRVDIRLIDVRTGEVVRSFSGHGRASNVGRASFLSVWNMYIAGQGAGTLSSLATLLTRASNQALQRAVRQLNDAYDDLVSLRANSAVSTEMSSVGDGKILADIGQGRYVIGVHSTANLKIGDRFKVIAQIPIKNSQGVVVYSEKRTVGSVQITDISESTKAMARLVNGPASGSELSHPKEGDRLVFNEKYGRSLRRLNSAGTGGAGGGNVKGGTTASVQTYIKRGNRFMENQEYSEALHQYREGLAIEPNNGKLLSAKAVAELGIDDFMDAEDDADKAIAAGGSIEIPMEHQHFINCSMGVLTVGKGNVGFQPSHGNDEFRVKTAAQISTSETSPYEVGPGGAVLPWLSIRWRNASGKWKKYNMMPTTFLTPSGLCKYIANNDGRGNTTRLEGMLQRLIRTALQ